MVSHSLFKQLITRVVGLILCCAETCDFGILKGGQTGRTFFLFPGLVKRLSTYCLYLVHAEVVVAVCMAY